MNYTKRLSLFLVLLLSVVAVYAGGIKNAQDLSALVQETQWCTKSLASTHLEQGDFYVFVDNFLVLWRFLGSENNGFCFALLRQDNKTTSQRDN